MNQGQLQIPHGYEDMQQYEDQQQRYTDVGGSEDIGRGLEHEVEQKFEKQLPPEQAYRNPDSQHTFKTNPQQEGGVPAHVSRILCNKLKLVS